jgi:pyruvate,water dikinase
MASQKKPLDRLLDSLQERSKELNCLYRIEEILSQFDESLEEIIVQIIQVIPSGLQYPERCEVKITLDNLSFLSPKFKETPWALTTDIMPQDAPIGAIAVYYTEEFPVADQGPFLDEEAKLLQTVAERLGHFIMYVKMRELTEEWVVAGREGTTKAGQDWQQLLAMLRQTDRHLYMNVSRKMLNHLCWSGVPEAEKLLTSFGSGQKVTEDDDPEEWNRPHRRRALGLLPDFSAAAFRLAAEHLTSDEILRLIQKWIQEDKLSFLVQVVNRNLSLAEVADAIRRYHYLAAEDPRLPSPSKRGILVSLIRRFLSDQLPYINVAKHYMEVRDFYNLLQNVIFTSESQGKLGGKSAGLYLATQILKKKAKETDLLSNLKIPKTWHITSDVLLHFMHYNNFDEVVEQKYKEIDQVRLEYPHIVQSFKSARFPADIIKSLSMALDDFGDHPVIVRSSSLLEDRVGSSFSGKYKSLFLANQGPKQQRLDALMDAIAEVYASTFSPDPVEYRAERGLIDFAEEMGIMIQEVVGTRVEKYFMPSFAGVAFCNNEFRWSPRINRKDGLVRLVVGLGTRAVDRLSNDYPILIAPGQPNLRVNVSVEEVLRYSPKMVDVLNLENNNFETIEMGKFLKEVGYTFPAVNNIVSIVQDDHIHKPMGMEVDFDHDEVVTTFEGLITQTPFVKQMQYILRVLEETIGTPVDVEFASDGTDLYLLQCRSQSYIEQAAAPAIPKDVPPDRIIFTADRYISNGLVPDITHIVYVDPKGYSELGKPSDLVAVGRAVGHLNKLLPKRRFILMGPGRWGSRGDIKLGVNVTYSEINNTAALIEIARKQGNYVPDLSFGTHFFQDLVEANIRYLPLYPDDDGIVFNESFLTGRHNILEEVLPEYAYLSDTIKLIDVPKAASGMVLRILMNAQEDRALGLLTKPGIEDYVVAGVRPESRLICMEDHWRWRMQMAERIAAELDPVRFGVAGLFVFGSTKNASAGAHSDIDLLVHFRGSPRQLEELKLWLNGWSVCLAEINYMRTGHQSQGLLDAQIITDADIARKTPYAAKIDAVTDAAMALPMKKPPARPF